jgi:diacylglycerol kinase family enzyme
MASFPSSSDGTYPSSDSDSDTESSTTNYGHVDDEPVHLSYQNGTLAWASSKLRDEDIITVTNAEGSVGHTIFSLDPDPGDKPFELRTTNTTLLPQAFLDRYLFEALPSHLQPGNDIHVLISTLSGTGLSPAFFDEILHPLLRAIGLADSRYSVTRTNSAESVKEFARSSLLVAANRGQKQTVLMLSGDGGMVDTINGLLESRKRSRYAFPEFKQSRSILMESSTYVRPTLSQFPLGTGNALFHSLHKPSSLPSIYIQGLRTLLHGTPKPLPIFYAKFSPGARLLTNEGQTATPLVNDTLYGAVVASYGLHATLVADSDTTEYRKHSDKRFGLVAKDLLFPEDGSRPHAYKAKVLLKGGRSVDGKEHGYVLASLVSNLEKAFTISPASRPLDGRLRVVHFGALDGEGTMEVMKGAYADGKHVGMDNVGYESVDGLRIEFKEEGESWKWRRCCIDGLIVGVEEGGWMEVGLVGEGNEVVDVVSDI